MRRRNRSPNTRRSRSRSADSRADIIDIITEMDLYDPNVFSLISSFHIPPLRYYTQLLGNKLCLLYPNSYIQSYELDPTIVAPMNEDELFEYMETAFLDPSEEHKEIQTESYYCPPSTPIIFNAIHGADFDVPWDQFRDHPNRPWHSENFLVHISGKIYFFVFIPSPRAVLYHLFLFLQEVFAFAEDDLTITYYGQFTWRH